VTAAAEFGGVGTSGLVLAAVLVQLGSARQAHACRRIETCRGIASRYGFFSDTPAPLRAAAARSTLGRSRSRAACSVPLARAPALDGVHASTASSALETVRAAAAGR